jgi:hypothetical protein
MEGLLWLALGFFFAHMIVGAIQEITGNIKDRWNREELPYGEIAWPESSKPDSQQESARASDD